MEAKKEKKVRSTSKQILMILAKKIKIMDEQFMQMRILVDELEDRIGNLERRVYDDREVHFTGENFLDDPDDSEEEED